MAGGLHDDDPSDALHGISERFLALSPQLRARFRSWVLSNITEDGERIPAATASAAEWKEFNDTAQSLEADFASVQFEVNELERTPISDTTTLRQNRAWPTVILFYEKGRAIQRMREKYPTREIVVNAAKAFEEYCQKLDFDPSNMPNQNALWQRRGKKASSP